MSDTPALLLANFLADTYQLRLCDIARPAQPENFSNATAWHIGSGQTAAFVSCAGAVAGASGAPCFLVFEKFTAPALDAVRNLPHTAARCLLEDEATGVAVWYGGPEALPFDRCELDHLRRMLPCVLENILLSGRGWQGRRPRVLIGVMCYNQAEYIDECLESLLCQTGGFDLEVLVLDDASTDDTFAHVLAWKEAQLPPHITLTAIQNKNNRGYWLGYRFLFGYLHKHGHDFIGFLDGDDVCMNSSRVQIHMDYLMAHPGCALSFNRLLIYDQRTSRFTVWDEQNDLDKPFFTCHHLADVNFIGNSGCTLIRANATHNFPKSFFAMVKPGDWFVHLLCAESGNIGFINKIMTTYRRNSRGVWGMGTHKVLYPKLNRQIINLNRLTNFRYYTDLVRIHREMAGEHLNWNGRHLYDLVIVDDVFPHPASGFRRAEFSYYLDHIQNIKIFISGSSIHLLGKSDLGTVARDFLAGRLEHAAKLAPLPKNRQYFSANAKLAYFCFLGNAWFHIDYVEKNRIPFVFELYPGGSFAIGDAATDGRLRRVMRSPCFCRVIVTQDVTRRYLLDGGFCREDQILELFGVVVPQAALERGRLPPRPPRLPGEPLNICFAAMKYTKNGADKGYGVFVETAKLVHASHPEARFHVIGNFDQTVLDVSALGGSVTFYGVVDNDRLSELCAGMHIFLSPNSPNVIGPGFFDGFPTGACIEAGLCGALMMCTDPLALNGGRFVDREEIDIITVDTRDIAGRIARYAGNPALLAATAAAGTRKILQLYGEQAQLAPRLALLREEIARYRENKQAIVRTLRPAMCNGQPRGAMGCIVFYAGDGGEFQLKAHAQVGFNLLWDGSFYIDIPDGEIPPWATHLRFHLYDSLCMRLTGFKAWYHSEPLKIQSASALKYGDDLYFLTKHNIINFARCEPGSKNTSFHAEGKLYVCPPAEEESFIDSTQKTIQQGTLFYSGRFARFNEGDSILFEYRVADGRFDIDVDLSHLPHRRLYLRLDILENHHCSCKLSHITLGGRRLRILWSNGHKAGGAFLFSTDDPNFFLGKHAVANGSVLHADGEIEVIRKEDMDDAVLSATGKDRGAGKLRNLPHSIFSLGRKALKWRKKSSL